MVASRSDNFKANYFQPEKSTWLDIVESLQCDPRVFIAMVFYFKMLFTMMAVLVMRSR